MRRVAVACKTPGAPVRSLPPGEQTGARVLEKISSPFRVCGEVVYCSPSRQQAYRSAPPVAVVEIGLVLSNALDNGSREMSKFSRVWLTLPIMAFAILPARAQVTIDVSKITCEQYVLFTVADPRDIAMWLSGYYNSRRSNTVLDTQQFREHGQKVMEYCRLNMKMTVMEAVEKVLGIAK
jgi:acid stress chaperone HdeB